MNEDLDALYDATCQATLTGWAGHEDTGSIRDRPFHPTKLSLTSGSFLTPHEPISNLLSQIRGMVGDDPLADALDPGCLHFTFLALSQPDYESAHDLPGLTDVRSIFIQRCHRQAFTVRHLRLVALPNALLLAGLPDAFTASLRAAFAKDLMGSSWAAHLRARHPTGPIPPPFWHSTLVRYHAEYLPNRLRSFFEENQTSRYGDLFLEIRLMATNYNWKIASYLDA